MGHAKTTMQVFEILLYQLAKDGKTLIVRGYRINAHRSQYDECKVVYNEYALSFLRPDMKEYIRYGEIISKSQHTLTLIKIVMYMSLVAVLYQKAVLSITLQI